MPRTNAAGVAQLLDGDVAVERRLEQAPQPPSCGVTKGRWYGAAGRANADDFPDAEEARRAAHAFGLSATWLQIELGLITPEDVHAVLGDGESPDPFRVTTRQRVLMPNPTAEGPSS